LDYITNLDIHRNKNTTKTMATVEAAKLFSVPGMVAVISMSKESEHDNCGLMVYSSRWRHRYVAT